MLAFNSGDKSGLLFLSIGVGTVTIKILAVFKSANWLVNVKWLGVRGKCTHTVNVGPASLNDIVTGFIRLAH